MKYPFLLALLLGCACPGAADADILVRTDGSILDGKIVAQNYKEIDLQADGTPAPPVQHVERAGITRVLRTDEHGALVSETGPDGKPPAPAGVGGKSAAKGKVPPAPAAPAVPAAAPAGPTYYLIPLHGAVGDTIQADALEKSLADAVLRKPTVVVLDIDSPGGLVAESEKLVKVLHHYNKQLRIVALADQDLSAAAVMTLSVREIYLKPSGTIGAATSFIPDNPNLSEKVEEKMQSAWRAVARNSAEEGGHEPLLADAMIDNDLELHLETVNGKQVVKEGPGEKTLCRKNKVLTLTSHEAVACGLAAGDAEDLADLGKALGFPDWTQCPGLGTLLADYLPKRAEAFKDAMKVIVTQFEINMREAANSDPAQGTVTRTVFTHPTHYLNPAYPPGMRHNPHLVAPQPGQVPQPQVLQVISGDVRTNWKAKSLACVVGLQKAEQNLADAIDAAKAFGHTTSAEALKDALTTISTLRASMYDERNKYGVQDTSVAVAGPPVSPAPTPVGPAALQRGVTRRGGAGSATVADARDLLASGDHFQQAQAARALATMEVDPAQQKKVVELLKPFLKEQANAAEQIPFAQAFGRWADKGQVSTLIEILQTPKPIQGSPMFHDECWAAVFPALLRLDPHAAEKVVVERRAEFFWRMAITRALKPLANADGPDKDRAIRLLGLLNAQ
jgi:hypothetical protein